MELKKFEQAAVLVQKIDRHRKSLEKLGVLDNGAQDKENFSLYDAFPMLGDYYPKEVSVPVVAQLRLWHNECIEKYQKEFDEL